MTTFFSVLFLVLLAGLTGASPNGLGAKPLMGWSTWCTSASCYQAHPQANGKYHDYCDYDMIISSADAVVSSGMFALGFEYILLDDCWAWTQRDANGNLYADPIRFPKGMADLVEQIHQRGLKIGLYTSVGPTTCSNGGRNHSVPGSFGHEVQDAKQFAAWNIDYVNMDYCDWHFNDSVLIPEFATARMYNAINSTGHALWFWFHCLTYNFLPSEWCKNYGNSFGIWQDHHDTWQTTTAIFDVLAVHPEFVGEFAWPDPDFLMTGGAGCDNLTPGLRCPGMTEDQYISEFSIWVLAGGQLVVSTDIRNMSALQKKILLNTEMLAVFNDPLKTIGRRIWIHEKLHSSVWAKHLQSKCVAVGFLNTNAANSTLITVHFAQLDWNRSTQVDIFDLWEHTSLPPATGSFGVEVKLYQTRVFKLCPKHTQYM